jgi:uncharacterized membrane protein
MKFLKNFGWLIPGVVVLILTLTTSVSLWLLIGIAIAVILVGYALGWLLHSRNRQQGNSGV